MSEKEELIRNLENMRDALKKPVNYVEHALIEAEFRLDRLRSEYLDLLQKLAYAEGFISSQDLLGKYEAYKKIELL